MDHEWAGNCWLKDGQGEIKSFTGLTSGPKYCKGESLLCGGSLQICSTFCESFNYFLIFQLLKVPLILHGSPR